MRCWFGWWWCSWWWWWAQVGTNLDLVACQGSIAGQSRALTPPKFQAPTNQLCAGKIGLSEVRSEHFEFLQLIIAPRCLSGLSRHLLCKSISAVKCKSLSRWWEILPYVWTCSPVFPPGMGREPRMFYGWWVQLDKDTGTTSHNKMSHLNLKG